MARRIVLPALLILASGLLISGCPKQTDTEMAKTDTTVQPPPVVQPPVAGGEAAKAESGAPDEAGKAGSEAEAGAAKAASGTAADAEALMVGQRLLMDRCTQCHGIDKVEKEKGDAEEWGKIVKRMQGHAAEKQKTPITDDEAKQILDHILATYAQ